MKPLEKILAAVDFSTLTPEVLNASYSLSQKFKAKLCVLNVLSQFPFDGTFFGPMGEQILKQQEKQAQTKLEETVSQSHGNIEVQTEVKLGAPYVEILKFSKQQKSNLIVIGSHGRKGLQRFLLGSVADTLVRRAECPVWVLKSKFVEPKKILLPVDLSEPSRNILPWALMLAKIYGASLHLLHVFEPVVLPDYMMVDTTEFELKMRESKREEFHKLVQELSNSSLTITSEFVEGDPRHLIEEVQKAQACDLVVLSTQGKSFMAYKLLGSVAAHAVRELDCSTVTLRPDGFKLKEI